MSEVQLPLVFLLEDSEGCADTYYRMLHDEFDVALVEDCERLRSYLDREVSVILVALDAVDGSPVEIARELRADYPGVRLAGIFPPERDLTRIGDRMKCLREPVSSEELCDLVQRLRKRARYDATVQRYFQLANERAQHDAADVQGGGVELLTDKTELQSDLQSLEQTLSETLEDFDESDMRALFRDF